MRRLTVLIFFNILLGSNIFSQPNWINKIPEGYRNDFFVGRGISKTSNAEAVQFALEDAIGSIIKNGRINIRSIENYNEQTNESFSEGKSASMDVVSKIAKEIIVEGSSRTIYNLKEVETYTEQNNNYYEAYVLVSIPKANPKNLPTAFSSVWRSTLLPGWGQLYKDETFKGLSFMTFTLGGIASGFVFNELSNDAKNKAFSARTQVRRDFYNNQKKDFRTYSTISFIAAGAFYSWSLIDAIAVKQDNLYVELKQDNDYSSIGIAFRF